MVVPPVAASRSLTSLKRRVSPATRIRRRRSQPGSDPRQNQRKCLWRHGATHRTLTAPIRRQAAVAAMAGCSIRHPACSRQGRALDNAVARGRRVTPGSPRAGRGGWCGSDASGGASRPAARPPAGRARSPRSHRGSQLPAPLPGQLPAPAPPLGLVPLAQRPDELAVFRRSRPSPERLRHVRCVNSVLAVTSIYGMGNRISPEMMPGTPVTATPGISGVPPGRPRFCS